ncbi:MULTISPECIES: hypothetical protein [Anaerotruncus]|uniref:hypothetical protein n=1 Tax=Anaerotruncus TaxID=244127 RepID=UPI00082FDC1E|nr:MULTISPECIES: hypothetical protein [Anaerotruncus]RGX52908.1 hypothetical protein DWV16_17515 [Anaerotruncus sp. AF02-27]
MDNRKGRCPDCANCPSNDTCRPSEEDRKRLQQLFDQEEQEPEEQKPKLSFPEKHPDFPLYLALIALIASIADPIFRALIGY